MADLASQWKAFTPEQRDQALSKMNPDQKMKLASALGYGATSATTTHTPPEKSLTEKLTEIQPHQVPHSAADVGREVVRGVGNIGAAGMSVLRHPLDTLEAAGKFALRASPPGELIDTLRGKPTATEEFANQVVHHPLETAETMVGQAGVTEGVGEFLRGAKATSGRTVEAVTGTGPRVTKNLVKETKTANLADAAKVADANHAAALKHLEDTQNALHETTGRELEHDKAVRLAKEVDTAKLKVQLTKHLADRAKALAQRQAAQEEFESAKAAQAKIEPQQEKLANARSSLRAAVETAREKSLKVGNEKYNAVNEKLNPLPADMEKVHGLYYQAAESFGEAQAQPALLTRLGNALKNNAEFTYEDEQKLYSELGKELSKGTLPGTAFHAYDLMHEGLGEDMQRIADSQGQGAQLTDARNYWRRMKQTFGKPISFTDAATKAIGGVKDEVQENAVRLLGSFDPEIPKLYSHVQNIEKGAEALPKPVPQRELTQKLAESRPPIPKVPERSQPEAVKPVERVAPPDRPTEAVAQPKKLGATEVQAAKAKALGKRADLVGHKMVWIAAGPPIYALANLLRGHGVNVGEVVGVSAGVGGLNVAVGRILENPAVADFLTKANARDVAKIPEDLRGDFPGIIEVARKRGIKVSPALLGAVMGSRNYPRGPNTRKLELLREQPVAP